MSNLLRRIERLEQLNKQKRGVQVMLFSWLIEGEITQAACCKNELLRNQDESKEDFCARVKLWAKSLPGEHQLRTVWLS
ncbi:MAG: hypothetical protein V4623_00200 [Pseudomonadota bacterium]